MDVVDAILASSTPEELHRIIALAQSLLPPATSPVIPPATPPATLPATLPATSPAIPPPTSPPTPPPTSPPTPPPTVICTLCGGQETYNTYASRGRERPKWQQDSKFRGLPQFNTEAGCIVAGSMNRVVIGAELQHPTRRLVSVEDWFGDKYLLDKLVNSLAKRRCMNLKEITESVEFFARTRKLVRSSGSPVVADLCCGHGLVGMLFAMMERCVTSVLLVDKRKPKNYSRVAEALGEIAPWALEKICFQEQLLSDTELPEGTSVVAVHACGDRTDDCVQLAVAGRGSVAFMPCCYSGNLRGCVPMAVVGALGKGLSTDCFRTRRLVESGYEVSWSAVPASVSKKNRIVLGRPVLVSKMREKDLDALE